MEGLDTNANLQTNLFRIGIDAEVFNVTDITPT
jgi:hypothetical protein